MSFLVTIIAISFVLRIVVHFIRNSQKQTINIIATIFIIEFILLFRAFSRIFNATVKLSARVEIVFILKISIIIKLISLIVFKELQILHALR